MGIRRGFLLLVMFLLAISSTSCRESPSANMDVSLLTSYFRLSNSADWSCLADRTSPQDIQPISINLRLMSVNWKGANPLTLESVRVVMNSPDISGGIYDKEVSGVDFNGFFNSATSPIVASGQAKASQCELKMGGLQLVDPTRASFGSGYVQIRGFTQEGEIDVSVSERAYFNFEFTPTE